MKVRKKIGREVLFLSTGEGNPRNGEGAFLRLKNGEILFVYTAYIGEDWNDHCTAELYGCVSPDEGETWSNPHLILKKPADSKNLMSVSLLRMQNGDIGLFYLKKMQYGAAVIDAYMLYRSSDEGKTWSEPVECLNDLDYYVVNNDRVVRLQNGSILIPVAQHSIRAPKNAGEQAVSQVCFLRSEDDGHSFRKTGRSVHSPFDSITVGLQEPGVYQFEDGRLWAWFRTNLGHQYESFSDDNGLTWSSPCPNLLFTSPCSPMQVRRIGKYTLAVYNPIPQSSGNPLPFGMDRTPLMLAVSDMDGKDFWHRGFDELYLLEDDPENSYCYPAITETATGFLVAYYHSNGTQQFLNCTKIVKVDFSEL